MTGEASLDDLGEHRLVAEVLARRYHDAPGFGDDCAPVPLAAGVGFELVSTMDPCPTPLVSALGWDDLYWWGWLLATVNLSDLAAAGAEPLGLMVSYILPGDLRVRQFERLLDGVDDCCRSHGTRVLGGNIGDGPAVHLTATAIGQCPIGARSSRRGARAGDVLVLVGRPGHLWAAALVVLGHAALPPEDADRLVDLALRPRAQVAAGRALAGDGLIRAAIDVSDGLYAAVAGLCDANHLGASVDGRVVLEPSVADVCRQAGVDPFSLLQLWGDWTLLVAVAPGKVARVVELARQLETGARVVGALTEQPRIVVERTGGATTWHGIANERFAPSSWHAGRLDDYVSWLRGGGPEPVTGAGRAAPRRS